MYISQIKLRGYRNYKDAEINLSEKVLIIGANEVGKSNLINAIRILLDKNLSEAELEPTDSDFYVYEDTNEIQIQVELSDVEEDCVLARLREHVGEDGKCFLVYKAKRDPRTKKKEYSIHIGRSIDTLKEIDSRFYIRVLNLKYIGSKRDLFSYIRRERRYLLQDAKELRTEDEQVEDQSKLNEINNQLEGIHDDVNSLTYIKKSTEVINEELDSLSIKAQDQNIIFDTQSHDPSEYVDNLQLASRYGDKVLQLGGDGKINQIHLSLWAARNRISSEAGEEPLEVSIYSIEEPEAHLHPHQQRKLATYLSELLPSQVIITSHSPQIACEFSPSSIIRLYEDSHQTLAAGDGINPFIEKNLIEFGYRMNLIPAEALFSDAVLLVEGPSEVLFYKALAKAIELDLDRLNMSLLSVGGVGFLTYASLYSSLRLPFVIRTDNDLNKNPNKDEFSFTGIKRGIAVYQTFYTKEDNFDNLIEQRANTINSCSSSDPSQEELEAVKEIIEKLEDFNIFIANKDLEIDLINSPLSEYLYQFANTEDPDSLLSKMTDRKATFMFNFLLHHANDLKVLASDKLAEPLLCCAEMLQ